MLSSLPLLFSTLPSSPLLLLPLSIPPLSPSIILAEVPPVLCFHHYLLLCTTSATKSRVPQQRQQIDCKTCVPYISSPSSYIRPFKRLPLCLHTHKLLLLLPLHSAFFERRISTVPRYLFPTFELIVGRSIFPPCFRSWHILHSLLLDQDHSDATIDCKTFCSSRSSG